MRFHPLIILPIYLISCPIIILSSPMIQKGILLRGPNWPYTCFRFYDIIFENLVTLIWELTTLVAHFSYFCCIFIVFWNILSNYPISSLKIRRVILIWELAAPIKLFLYFHDISTIFYNILSNYPISSLKIWWVILIWELAALIKLSSFVAIAPPLQPFPSTNNLYLHHLRRVLGKILEENIRRYTLSN